MTEGIKQEQIERIASAVNACSKCPLASTRIHAVPGEGNPEARIMFIGEGPGQEEDKQGRPFVGQAGQLLDKMMAAIGLDRTNAYIANIVKCRPPQNRVPEEEEANECLYYLRKQFAVIKPKIVVCLGATAAKYIIDRNIRITRDRGNWYEKMGTSFIATYHPSALLRDPEKKKDAWEDMKSIKAKLDEISNL